MTYKPLNYVRLT